VVKAIEEVPTGQSEPHPIDVPIAATLSTEAQTASVGSVESQQATKGQSEADPTAQIHIPTLESALTHLNAPENAGMPAEPTGRYASKRYYDHPYYVSLQGWLAEGGTEDDYNWRPASKIAY